MKNKFFIRMFGALLMVVCFASGHASHTCTANKPEPLTRPILESPAVHFGPLDMLKW